MAFIAVAAATARPASLLTNVVDISPDAPPRAIGTDCFRCKRYFVYDDDKVHSNICSRCLLSCRDCGVFVRKPWNPYREPSLPLSGFKDEHRRQTVQAILDSRERPDASELDRYYATLTKEEKSDLPRDRCAVCFYENAEKEHKKAREIDVEFEQFLASQPNLYERIEWTCVDCKGIEQCYVPLGFPRKAVVPLEDVCQMCDRNRIIKHRAELIEKRRQELSEFELQKQKDAQDNDNDNAMEARYYVVEKLHRFGGLYISTHLGYFPGNHRGPDLEKTEVSQQVELCTPFVQKVVDDYLKRGKSLPAGVDSLAGPPFVLCAFLVKVSIPKKRFAYTTELPERLLGRQFGSSLRQRYSMFLAYCVDIYTKLARSKTDPLTDDRTTLDKFLPSIGLSATAAPPAVFTIDDRIALWSILRPSIVPTIDNYRFTIYGGSSPDEGESYEDVPRRVSNLNPFEPEEVDFEEDKTIYKRPEIQDALSKHRTSDLFVFDARALMKGVSTYKNQIEYPKHNPILVTATNGDSDDDDDDDDD